MSLIEVRDVGYSFGARAVFQGVTFSVTEGDRMAVLGASGAGKSTLLRLLAKLDMPRQGKIERTLDLKIGMVFQDLALWPNMTAQENVAVVLKQRRRSVAREMALAALEKCQVDAYAERLPGSLSIGQQQRVALARAIVGKPGVLLLDEPFSSLDLILKQELFAMIREAAAGRALVLVTHDPLEALALCSTALVIESGKVVEQGNLRELLAAPRSQLLRIFKEQVGSVGVVDTR
jgi:ABC-type Fe3+/spermidine/putrescine transport system ATPase subunit